MALYKAKTGYFLRASALTSILLLCPAESRAMLQPPAEAGEIKVEELPPSATVANPHESDEYCPTCHNAMSFGGEEISFRFTEDGVVQWTKLCGSCHAQAQVIACIHPLRGIPANMSIPPGWPREEGGVLHCVTCHYMPYGGLMSDGETGYLRDGPYLYMTGICWSCHLPEEFRTTDPHKDYALDKGCTICHLSRPVENLFVELRADATLLCIRCHDETAHPASHDHTGIPDKRWAEHIPEKTLPLDASGRVTCATCHDPHLAKRERRLALRGSWSSSKPFCLSCHEDH